jgi:hypothetical protein
MSNVSRWGIEGNFTSHGHTRNCRCTWYKCYLPHDDIYILTEELAVTLHNLTFQARVMGQARDSIMNGTFPSYLHKFFGDYFGDVGYPEWCVNALRSVGVDLLEGRGDVKVVKGSGTKWEYSDVV